MGSRYVFFSSFSIFFGMLARLCRFMAEIVVLGNVIVFTLQNLQILKWSYLVSGIPSTDLITMEALFYLFTYHFFTLTIVGIHHYLRAMEYLKISRNRAVCERFSVKMEWGWEKEYLIFYGFECKASLLVLNY